MPRSRFSIPMGLLWLLSVYPPAVSATLSGQVLEINLDARTTALANAATGMNGDAALLWNNPAAIFSCQDLEFRASYRRDLEDVNFGSLTAAVPLGRYGTLGASLLTLYGGKLDLVETGQQVIAQQDYVLTAGWAKDLAPLVGWGYPLGLGVSATYLQSVLAEEFTGRAFLGSVGLAAGLPVSGLSLGAALKNFGTDITYDVNPDQLPLTVSTGLSWTGALSPVFGLLVNVDALQPLERKFLLQTGAELSIIRTLLLRCGYRFFHDTDTFTVGIGFSVYHFRLDYAFLENELAAKHLVTLGYRFAPPPPQEVKPDALALAAKGIALYKQGRLQEAEAAWAEVLAKYPDNPAAKKYLAEFSRAKQKWLADRNDQADALIVQEDYAGATYLWQGNLERFPQDARSKAGMAWLRQLAEQQVQSARQFQARRQWVQALASLEQAQRIVPDYPPALRRQKIIYRLLEREKGQQDSMIRASINSSRKLAKEGKPVPAMEILQKALTTSPNLPALLQAQEQVPLLAHEVALKLKDERQYLAAMDLWQDIMVVAPDFQPAKEAYRNTDVYYQEKIKPLDVQALAAYQGTRYAEAIRLWEERYRLAPEKATTDNLVRAYLADGILHYRQNRLERAIQSWERVLQLDPQQSNVKAYLTRARNKIVFLRKLGLEVSQ